jgi:membrane-bound lytic murein transglycosylase MltF
MACGKNERKCQMKNIYDLLIKEYTEMIFPLIDWRIIKCQVNQESAFNPNAVSPCGALGLLQLMPGTAQEMGIKNADSLLYPETNLATGIKYLKIQYDHFGEIPTHEERVKFALGAYNGGRGYLNVAIKLSIPANPFYWQKWDVTAKFLAHKDCEVRGKHPDHKQITDYVRRIWGNYLIEKEK